ELSKRKGVLQVTKHMEIDVGVVRSGEQRMKLQYGVNQADQCLDFAMGPNRERIWARLREIDTRIVRLFLFDKGAPDHLKQWDLFAAYVQAVLTIAGNPLLPFAKFHPPFSVPWLFRPFAERPTDVFRRCSAQWAVGLVRNWNWA